LLFWKNIVFFWPGSSHFFAVFPEDLGRLWPVLVRAMVHVQVLSFGPGVGMVPGRECRFLCGAVLRMGVRVVLGMVPVFFFVALLVRAGCGSRMGFGIIPLAVRAASRRHSQYFCCLPIKQFLRAFIRQTGAGRQAWTAISWQYCPAGKMMLMD
jgi:hypothetical protein